LKQTNISRLARGWTLLACLAVVLTGILLSLPALAQQPKLSDDPALKAEYDALFAQTLKDPANVGASFRYADVATRMGDFEAAIGALERIIFYSPNLPRVRLELGVLYFRLGSYEMARSYFESAISGDDVPPAVRNRVAGFLTEIERRLQTTQMMFFGQVGLRYQSNANAGPNSPNVRALGYDAILSRQYTKKADWNTFGLAGFRYIYDLGNQRGDVLEAQATTYYARQFDVTRLNTGLVEASFGPRLALAPDELPGWSIKPYVLGGGVTLGDNPYLVSTGGGVSFAIPLTSALLEPGYEIRRRSYRNSSEIPNATDQRGLVHTVYMNASAPITMEWRWNTRLAFNRVDARVNHYSYRSFAADAGLIYEFSPSFVESARKWVLNPFVGYTQTRYDEANWIVDPYTRRRDREWRIGSGLDMPLWPNAGLGLLVQYTNVRSNIPNYSTRNFSVTFGPTVKF